MRNIVILIKGILFFVLTGYYGCVSVSSRTITLQKDERPLWVDHHPRSRTHFIGVGGSSRGMDLYRAQQQARDRALNDIAQQIKVSIISDISLHENVVSIDNTSINKSLLKEKIATMTEAVLSEWEEVRTWQSSDGYYWSKVVLSKKKYYEKVNRKVNEAIEKVCDIIRYSSQGSARERIQQLYKGIEILDSFVGMELKGTVHGRDVVLYNELHRCLAAVMERVDIMPVTSSLILSASQPIPENLGVNVFYSGKKDSSLSVKWTTSHNDVGVINTCHRIGNFCPALISSLSPSKGTVTITATIDLGTINYDLIKRRIVLPRGTFTLRRKKAPFYLDRENTFSKALAKELSNRSSIIVVDDVNEAEYLLTTDFINENKTVLQNSIYIADAELTITLFAKNGIQIIDLNKKVRVADGVSALRAIENTERYALDIAVKQVEMIF